MHRRQTVAFWQGEFSLLYSGVAPCFTVWELMFVFRIAIVGHIVNLTSYS